MPGTVIHRSSSPDPHLAALRAGDQEAFRDLVSRKHGSMKRVARGFVASDAVAEEVVQETWLAVINGIDRFESRASLDTWISSILVNQARRHGVREHRFDTAANAPLVGGWATPPRPWQHPERRLLSLEARARLRRALERLPERQRQVIGLRDVEGCSAEEARAALELSDENQRVLLHRGRARLRAELDDYLEEAA